MTDTQEPFRQWCIVEVMGYSRYAGLVSEQTIGGASFVRVDVPAIDESVLQPGESAIEGFTKLLSAGSIFAITPCTEATARHAVRSFRSRPMTMYELPMMRSLPSPDDPENWEDDP